MALAGYMCALCVWLAMHLVMQFVMQLPGPGGQHVLGLVARDGPQRSVAGWALVEQPLEGREGALRLVP